MKLLKIVLLMMIANQGYSANIDPLANYLLQSSIKKEFFRQAMEKSNTELGDAAWPEIREKLDYSKNFKFIEEIKSLLNDLALDDEVDDIENDQAWYVVSEYMTFHSKRKIKKLLEHVDFSNVCFSYTLAQMTEYLDWKISTMKEEDDFKKKSSELGLKLNQYLNDEQIKKLTEKI